METSLYGKIQEISQMIFYPFKHDITDQNWVGITSMLRIASADSDPILAHLQW